jgi:uncharacterized protein (TIGR00730 family)
MHKRPLLERAHKAYKNQDFLNSKDARLLRIMAEYMFPEQHFKRMEVHRTIIFFGSARIRPVAEIDALQAELQTKLTTASEANNADKAALQDQYDRLEKQRSYARYYDDARTIARGVTEWSAAMPPHDRFLVCSGGGPGIMEAANRGADDAGGESVGLNISLPFEQYPNQFITPDLNFEFHYFFMRKFWFMHYGKALIVFPGGFGTLDELFEALTLVQTQKIKKSMPIVLFGKDFWTRLLNFDLLIESGMISPEDVDLFRIFDDPQETIAYLTGELSRIYAIGETK